MRRGFLGLVGVLLAGTMLMATDTFLIGSTLELGNQGAYIGGDDAVGPPQYLVQPFSLNTTVSISSVSLALVGPSPVGGSHPPRSFLVQIADAIGPGTTAANVLADGAGTFPSGTTPEVVSVPLSTTLAPGNYYLVLSSALGAGSWTQSNSTLPSMVGTVITPAGHAFDNNADTAFPPASFWNSFSEPSTKFSFQLFGTAAIAVDIDIKPGSYPNSINLGSNGVVAVGILSSATFDATTVNPSTVTLAGAAVRLKGKGTPTASFADLNGDGRLDLVVHVSTEALQLSDGDTEAELMGQTFDGRAITGVDSVRIVSSRP